MRGAASTSFLWALAASMAAHSLFLAFPLGDGSAAAGSAAGTGSALVATLVLQPQPIEPSAALTSTNAVLLARPEPAIAPPRPVAPVAPPTAPSATPSDVVTGTAADVEVESQPLADRAVLGDLLSREQAEFPIEIDVPPRVEGRIVVKYPSDALASAREGTVAIWVVVDARGEPDEIQVVEGDQEFADAVVAAIRGARFQPARNNLVPIRFPIAMEFHFALDSSRPVAHTNTAATP